MKKLIPFITPIVLFAFIYATTPSFCQAGNPPTTLQVAYSTNLQHWVDLSTIDLSTAKANPTTGQLEIFVEVELPYNPAMDQALFFKSSENMTLHYLNTPIIPVDPQPMMISCGGWIIAVLIVVVGGIIVYYLIKTCKRLLS